MKRIISIVTILVGLVAAMPASAEWVYIGKYGADGVISTGFKVDALPAVGDAIRATQGMHLRDAAPHVKEGKWQFGKAVSILHIGQQFVVEELARSRKGAAPGDVWARGTVQR